MLFTISGRGSKVIHYTWEREQGCVLYLGKEARLFTISGRGSNAILYTWLELSISPLAKGSQPLAA